VLLPRAELWLRVGVFDGGLNLSERMGWHGPYASEVRLGYLGKIGIFGRMARCDMAAGAVRLDGARGRKVVERPLIVRQI
jgi:hypothetical protein